jgi:uncharacterized protein (DUF952 family)
VLRLTDKVGNLIYHITSRAEAHHAARVGVYTPLTFEGDGFIHCSYANQLCDVANRFFGGRTDLVVLEIDYARLASRVVDENLENGAERFPHLYGRLPMEAVVGVQPFPCDAAGRFTLPEPLRAVLEADRGRLHS